MGQERTSKTKRLAVYYTIAIIIIAAVLVYLINLYYSRDTAHEITFGTTEILNPDCLQKNNAGWKVAALVYLNYTVRLTKISLYVKAEGTAKVKCAIYENDPAEPHPNSPEGTPNHLIAQTFEVTVNETPQIHAFEVPGEVIINPGYYWLAVISSETIYTTSSNPSEDKPYGTMCYNANTYNDFTDPFGAIDYAAGEDKTIYGAGTIV